MPDTSNNSNLKGIRSRSANGVPGDTERFSLIRRCFDLSSLAQFRCLIVAVFVVLAFCLQALAAEIEGPEVKIKDNEIRVTTALVPDGKLRQDLRSGMTKELRFYVDLFRVWRMWPDEFILNKIFVRTLKSDPVKQEYIATSNDGSVMIQKRFKSLESMLQWSLSIDNLKLSRTTELEPSVYYVRVTVESRIRKLPPVIGYFMIFLPENEFKITKDSPPFVVGRMR